MRQMNIGAPQNVPTFSRAYSQFRGVDFSTDNTQVDQSRSPSSKNMISDTAGFPEKRPGWRFLHQFNREIHNVFYAVFGDGERGLYAHVGEKIYKWEEPDEATVTEHAPVEVVSGMADARSCAFAFDGKIYLMDGTKYRVLKHTEDGYELKNVTDDDPYVPTVRISITGNEVTQIGSTDEYFGGHTYEEFESPSILTYKRKCTMCGDGVSKIFFLPEEDIDSVDEVTVNGEAITGHHTDDEGEGLPDGWACTRTEGKLEFKVAPAIDPDGAGLANIEVTYTCRPKKQDEKNVTGDGETVTFDVKAGFACIHEIKKEGEVLEEGTDYTADSASGTVTFTTAPEDGKNVFIKWAEYDDDKDIGRIDECTIVETYGYYNDNRWFASGVPGERYQNIDYMSGSGDPTYWPYTGYVRVGADTSRIVGYLKQYDSLLIIKEDNEQDAQVFMRTASYDEADGAMFPVKQGIKGVGAVSREAFGVLRDDPMFLSDEGVFAVTGAAVKEQQTMQNRSYYVNKKLMAEPGLDRACAAVHNGYFYLAVNGHCYVADSRQMTAASDTGAYGYEWYYWENFPAKLMFKEDDSLYFTTKEEKAYAWAYEQGVLEYTLPAEIAVTPDLYIDGEQASYSSYSFDAATHVITLANAQTEGAKLEARYLLCGICKLNTDYDRMYKYADGAWPMRPYSMMTPDEQAEYDALADDSKKLDYRRKLVPGVAIESVWTTKADTFDTIINLKNIPKKGCAIIIKPYTRSSIEIGYSTDREGQRAIRETTADIFDFSDIDFERITFNTIDVPQVIPLNRKIKKFNLIQFIIKSTAINEGFGIYGIQVSYTIGRYVK